MRQSSDLKTLQFSKIPHNGRVLEEKKNLYENQYYLKPSAASKKVTFGAKLTNLTNSNVSLLSSTSSLGYSNNLTLSRSSFENQPRYINENRISFSMINNQRSQPLTNRQNSYSILPLMKKAYSNIEQQNEANQPLLQKYKIKPALEQSIILRRHDSTTQIIPQYIEYQKRIQQQSQQITKLKNQIQSINIRYEQQSKNWKQNQNTFQNSINELNLIVSELRNTKQYQKQIIYMLEQKSVGFVVQKDDLVRQIQRLNKQIRSLVQTNDKLVEKNKQSLSKSINLSQNSLSFSFDSKPQSLDLEKTISNQNNIIKNTKSDLKKCQQKIIALQKVIQNTNADILKNTLFQLNKKYQEIQQSY